MTEYKSLAAGKVKEVVWWCPDAGSDLKLGIKQLVKDRNIKAGVITTIFGAVRRARFSDFIELPQQIRHTEEEYADQKEHPGTKWKRSKDGIIYGLFVMEGDTEVNGQGVIGENLDTPGEPYLHCHVTFSQGEHCYVGHLEEGTLVASSGMAKGVTSHLSVVIDVFDTIKVRHSKGSINLTQV